MPALSQSLSFTVRSTSTTAIVYPNTATSTLIYTSDKVKGDGYYGGSDGLHTVMYIQDSGFVGTVTMQATLATDPVEADWFNIVGTTSTTVLMDAAAAVNSYNFTGNFVWVRGYVAIADGTLESIQYNH